MRVSEEDLADGNSHLRLDALQAVFGELEVVKHVRRRFVS